MKTDREKHVVCHDCGEVASDVPSVETRAPVNAPRGHLFPTIICECGCSNWVEMMPRGFRLNRRGAN